MLGRSKGGGLGRVRRGAMAALLALEPPRANDPAQVQIATVEAADRLPFFGDASYQKLTGNPAMQFRGETTAPQVIVTHPNLAQIDPVVGISVSGAGKWPSLPSRRPPANLGAL